ncbi:MAG: hypothetical protein S0880_19170 [Actinomycetota bacterium]|nr:hypothetical protein [Actinomycetota bacterium]
MAVRRSTITPRSPAGGARARAARARRRVAAVAALVLAAGACAPDVVDDGRTLRATTEVSGSASADARTTDTTVDVPGFTETTTPTTSGDGAGAIELTCTAEKTERTTLLLRWTPLVGVPYYSVYEDGEWSRSARGGQFEQPFMQAGPTSFAVAPWLGPHVPPPAAACGTIDVADDEWWAETTFPPSTIPPEDAALGHRAAQLVEEWGLDIDEARRLAELDLRWSEHTMWLPDDVGGDWAGEVVDYADGGAREYFVSSEDAAERLRTELTRIARALDLDDVPPVTVVDHSLLELGAARNDVQHALEAAGVPHGSDIDVAANGLVVHLPDDEILDELRRLGARTIADELVAEELGRRAGDVIERAAAGIDVAIVHDYLHPRFP